MPDKTKKNGIDLAGGYFLRPVDALNWELCRLTKPSVMFGKKTKGGNVVALGRYYQWDTIPYACAYVADLLVRADARDEAMSLTEAADAYSKAIRESGDLIWEKTHGTRPDTHVLLSDWDDVSA